MSGCRYQVGQTIVLWLDTRSNSLSRVGVSVSPGGPDGLADGAGGTSDASAKEWHEDRHRQLVLPITLPSPLVVPDMLRPCRTGTVEHEYAGVMADRDSSPDRPWA